MIDTDKYEGHTPGPWMWLRDDSDVDLVVANDQCHTVLEEVKALYSEANENLIADAPLILEELIHYKKLYEYRVERFREDRAEIERLRGLLQEVADDYTDADGITYEIYCEFGGEEE